MGKSYVIRTYGCQMNEHDSERISGLLEADGMWRVDDEAQADVIVLNTCCIRENADNKLYGALGNLKALKQINPDLQIVVGGCLAQKDRDLIRERAAHVDVVFGTHNVDRAVELLNHAAEHGPIVEILEATARADGEAFPSALPTRREVDHASWVTVQIGCDNTCAFCIVPAVRGPEISRPFGELVAEVEDLAQDGVSEITLLGQNVNSYGRDLALARRAEPSSNDHHWCGHRWLDDRRARPLFADLLRATGAVEGINRVRFTSPHPKDMGSETFNAMADVPEVCEHLHFPLQSGSDRVLAAMHRGYTAERYLKKLREARATIPDLAVSTDIIVGFPSETDDDFERTLEVAAEAEFDSAFTFVFSPRPGTEAAEMEADFVDHAVAVERYERLRVVIERSSRSANESRVGLTEEVVVEGPSKKDPKVLTGRTRRNTLVHFPSPTSLRAGTYARVEVESAGMNHMSGRLVDVTVPARHRTRIPVMSI
ncbi:MAG: MiaB/RimO family radical SAM methylthiotransferase [Acidimicrobiaceae bacterium]|nr:MiaB/RimO family radical SAM methylthiotransferase [Acidimicrobiaceae bacterium]